MLPSNTINSRRFIAPSPRLRTGDQLIRISANQVQIACAISIVNRNIGARHSTRGLVSLAEVPVLVMLLPVVLRALLLMMRSALLRVKALRKIEAANARKPRPGEIGAAEATLCGGPLGHVRIN